MILHYLLLLRDNLMLSFISSAPVWGTPEFYVENITEILSIVMTFNNYLPIVEAMTTVMFCLGCTLAFKIAKIVLGIVQVNLGA